ncbi:MAG: DUF2339 domain-containing protein [Polyangiaceae bacterium]|nr:DUF2339 domain-containing protein [Polyangiaceae bacterium]
MEGFLLLAGFAAIFYFIVLPIMAFLASSKIQKLETELAKTNHQLSDLTERLVVLTAERTAAYQPRTIKPVADESIPKPVQTIQSRHPETEVSGQKSIEVPPAPALAKLQSVGEQPIVISRPHPIHVPEAPSEPAVTQPLAMTEAEPLPPQALATQAPQPSAPPPWDPSIDQNVSQRPQWLDRFFAWCIGGNPLVRIGILVLFFGVSFLLKLAASYGWFPLELRLAGVAAGAAALLGIGWRLREKRRNYGLLLQGGGVGILYLVIYSAFAYFKLIPADSALLAFALLFCVCALSAFLAVRQDASALAVMGMTGGFAAPALISTGSGNHILLFSYFALLNAGVLGIAWFRAWRALNLLGFAFTLGIGSAWALKYYTPAHLLSVEGFLLLFFLFYVAVALLYAIRRELELKRYVDGTLVFGAPIAFSLLQTRLMANVEFGMAWSMVALGVLYLLLAAWVARYRLERLRLYFESLLALSVLFLTLAVPLAFEGTRLTAAIWAVEGAGLCWVAVRQQRRLALAGGLALQVFGALSFFYDPSGHVGADAPLVLNSWYLGALMLSLSALFCGWRLKRDAAQQWLDSLRKPMSFALGVAGLLWWIGSGYVEILRYFGPFETHFYAYLLFAALTAWLARAIGHFLHWTGAEWVALAFVPVLLVGALLSFSLELQPLSGWGLLGWGLSAVLAYALLFQQERHAVQPSIQERFLGPLHAVMFWTICLVAGLEFHGFVGRHVPEGVWQWSSWAFGGALLLLALIHVAPRFHWPVGRFRMHYLTLGAAPVVLVQLVWALVSFASAGNPAPLPYIPLLNPVELCQLLILATLYSWWRANREILSALFRTQGKASSARVLIGISVLLFVLLNIAMLRTLHQYTTLDYQIGAVVEKLGAQLYFVVLWVVFASAGIFLLRRANAPLQRSFLNIVLVMLTLLWLWSAFSNFSADSTSTQWGTFPLFNAFDSIQASVIGLSFLVLARLRAIHDKPHPHMPILPAVIGLGGSLWLNAMLLRALHRWLGIPYTFDALYASTAAQAAVSLLWGFLALVLMVWAVRRAQRAPWFIGIALLALTVAKLFLVELAHIGGSARIISFIGVGVLLLLIGYLAPLPPKRQELKA